MSRLLPYAAGWAKRSSKDLPQELGALQTAVLDRALQWRVVISDDMNRNIIRSL